MFRVNNRYRMELPSLLQGPGRVIQQFRLVEQCFNVPLWHIRVLPKATDPDDLPRWTCMLVSTAVDALGILSEEWESEKVDILIPEYLTGEREIRFARCLSLWECRALEDEHTPVWLFETDHGSYVDPEFDLVQPNKVKKLILRWPAR